MKYLKLMLAAMSGCSLLFPPSGTTIAARFNPPQPGIPVACQIQQIQQYPDSNLGGRGLLNPEMPMSPFDLPIDRYLQQKQYLQARQLAEASNSPSVHLATLQRIADLREQAGQTAEIKSLVNQMAVLVPKVTTPNKVRLSIRLWLDLGHRHLRLGERERALAAFTQAAQIAQTARENYILNEFTPKAVFLEEVAAAFITAKQPASALPLLAQSLSIVDPLANNHYVYHRARIVVLANLSVDYGKLGQPATASQLLQRSLDIIRSLPGRGNHDVAFSQVDGYGLLLDRLADAGQTQTALQVINEMVSRAKPDNSSRENMSESSALRSAIEPLLELRQVEKALEFARRIRNDQVQFAAIQAIALYYHRQKQPQAALKLLTENQQKLANFTQRYNRANPTMDLVKSYLEIGEYERAISLTQQSRAANILGQSMFETMMTQSIKQLVLAKHFTRANALIQAHQPLENSELWLDVAMAYLEVRQWSAATQLVKLIQDTSTRDRGLREIILAHAEARRYQDAYRLAQQLSPQQPETAQILQLLSCANPALKPKLLKCSEKLPKNDKPKESKTVDSMA